MQARPFEPRDLPGVLRLWNGAVRDGEMLLKPMTEAGFLEKFKEHPRGGAVLLALGEKGEPLGFAAGSRLRDFLPGQTEENTPGYLNMLLVDRRFRGRGCGRLLLSALEERLRALGKTRIAVSGQSPVQLPWLIPGTQGHEHNNAPGADEEAAACPFLRRMGYRVRGRAAAMYLNLGDFRKAPDIEERRQALARQGITAGLYDPALNLEYDGLFDRVGSEYWRKVLADELARPKPRPILAAWVPGHLVAFTGPVDREESGRGWFTGICTDPLYERRGIATVLFSDLMEAFLRAGAGYSTLFTGADNHARRLYEKTGFRVVRCFAMMEKSLEAAP